MLQIGIDLNRTKKAVFETVEANRLKSARVRITVTPGVGSLTPDPGTCTGPTVLITAAQYTPYPAATYEKGFRAIISSARRNSQSTLPGMKTTCFLENILARNQAQVFGVDDVLFLSDKGMLAEASSSNIFLARKGILKTPKVGSGLLPGITREVVLELAAQSGIKTQETDIRPEELIEAEEAFLTNSMVELMPLTAINRKKIGSGKPGAITWGLMAAYRELVSKEIRSK